MTRIQIGLLDVMNYLVQELKKHNKNVSLVFISLEKKIAYIFYLQLQLDLEELSVENAVAKKFHKQLQLQLDPIWDQLSSKSKQLVTDLKMLRALLM